MPHRANSVCTAGTPEIPRARQSPAWRKIPPPRAAASAKRSPAGNKFASSAPRTRMRRRIARRVSLPRSNNAADRASKFARSRRACWRFASSFADLSAARQSARESFAILSDSSAQTGLRRAVALRTRPRQSSFDPPAPLADSVPRAVPETLTGGEVYAHCSNPDIFV
jgi:hypothetical protein